jgi:hypothetical protein
MQPLHLPKNKRAQVLSSEFILASGIFLLILTSVFVLWNTISLEMAESEINHEIDEVATNAIEKLVRTSGYPVDWENLSMNETYALGLSSDSRILSRGKILRFLNITSAVSSGPGFDNPCNATLDPGDPPISNYNCSRYLLGMGRYDFYFEITDINGTTVNIQGQDCLSGVMPVGDVTYQLPKRRNAMFEGDIVQVTLVVWYG